MFFMRLTIRLLPGVLLAFYPLLARDAGSDVPAGAQIIFEDAFPQAEWKGAKVDDGGEFGISGRVLVPVGFEDTVRLEREVDFTLGKENFINFQFLCSGYQHLRILAWANGQDRPKSVTITHFSPEELQKVNIPVEGNFHNYHWRQGDYGNLNSGDRIQRLALEFSLTEKVTGNAPFYR